MKYVPNVANTLIIAIILINFKLQMNTNMKSSLTFCQILHVPLYDTCSKIWVTAEDPLIYCNLATLSNSIQNHPFLFVAVLKLSVSYQLL